MRGTRPAYYDLKEMATHLLLPHSHRGLDRERREQNWLDYKDQNPKTRGPRWAD